MAWPNVGSLAVLQTAILLSSIRMFLHITVG